jgi:hypothetical protein
MDDILKIKTKDPKGPNSVTESQRKHGLAVGLEAITIYMNAFAANVRHLQLQRRSISVSQWESLIKLWEFMDSHCRDFPALQALGARIGALCREELRRVGVDSKEYQNKDQKCLDLLRINDKERDRLWARSHASRSILADLGVTEVLGPWTTISDATNFAMDVLGAFSKKEKLNWKRDSGN